MNDMKLELKPKLVPATIADYPTIQNMARFYVYDMSRTCGFISKAWACPLDGLFESFDFQHWNRSTSSPTNLDNV